MQVQICSKKQSTGVNIPCCGNGEESVKGNGVVSGSGNGGGNGDGNGGGFGGGNATETSKTIACGTGKLFIHGLASNFVPNIPCVAGNDAWFGTLVPNYPWYPACTWSSGMVANGCLCLNGTKILDESVQYACAIWPDLIGGNPVWKLQILYSDGTVFTSANKSRDLVITNPYGIYTIDGGVWTGENGDGKILVNIQ